MEVALHLLPATSRDPLRAARPHARGHAARRAGAGGRACFYGGLTLIVVSLTAMGPLADELFWAHMVEHLLSATSGRCCSCSA